MPEFRGNFAITFEVDADEISEAESKLWDELYYEIEEGNARCISGLEGLFALQTEQITEE